MKKINLIFNTIFLISILFSVILDVSAQTESVNIYKYTPQPGFRKSKLDGKTEFYFKKDKKWVIIDLYDIKPSKGNAVEDAQNDWNEIVLKNYVIKGDVVTENREQDGWQITARTAVTSIIKYNLSLITLTCQGGHASILLTNNDFSNVLDAEIGAFIGSLSFVSPAEAVSLIKPVVNSQMPPAGNYQMQGMNPPPPPPSNVQMPGTNPSLPNPTQVQGITPPLANAGGNFIPTAGNFDPPVAPNPYHPPFPTPGEQPVKASILMDVGWFVEATNDYMQYTKPDIKVVEYFLTETPYPNKDAYWQNYLSRDFAAETYYTLNDGPSYFSFEFAWANAVYKPTGQPCFIAWLVDYNVPAAFVAITSSESVFRNNFPDNKMLGEMQRFNNFPVDMQQIQGKWGDSNFAGAQMYEVNTGNYAGMSMASAASSYTFSGNTFRFFTQGATGMVGTAKAFQAEETGTFDVNGYNLVTNVTSRTDQMTNSTMHKNEQVQYSVAFKYAKNAKILFMQNKQYTGLTYNLVRMQ